MNRNILFFLVLFLLSTFSIRAQNTDGTDFWLTFGRNELHHLNTTSLTLQIRIVSRELHISGTIYFTNLNSSIPFEIEPQSVYTYSLSDPQQNAVYNPSQSKSNRSIHIFCDNPVTAYALNQTNVSADATNLLPTPVFGTEYYQISYKSVTDDAYAVIAIEDNTQIFENGFPLSGGLGILNAGDVSYRTSFSDMTGYHITSDKPVAFFAMNQGAMIPIDGGSRDCFMQQLAPVNTWGDRFFVPVSIKGRDRVRIVASQPGTSITQTGGTLIYGTGGQSSYTLNSGQFIELETYLYNNGCFIEADKPVGVCTYLTCRDYNPGNSSDPAQAWLPSIQQAVTEAIVAPFIPPAGTSVLENHYALLVTPSDTKNDTRVSVGGAPPASLSGGNWIDNADAGMSFYNMPLIYETESYKFTNDNGFVIMGYGIGPAESYYYLAFSAMLNLQASFSANDVHYQNLPEHLFCENDVVFKATINVSGMEVDSMKWYIDNVEQMSAQNMLTWDTTFSAGIYDIEMRVYFDNEDTLSLTSTLNIGAIISSSALPPAGGTTSGNGCYKTGTPVNLVATPNAGYFFINWTENGNLVSSSNPYKFDASEDRILVANFLSDTTSYEIVLLVNPSGCGTVTGAGFYGYEDLATINATPNTGYLFVNWTEDGIPVSMEPSLTITVIENHTFTANLKPDDYTVIVFSNSETCGDATGNGIYNYGDNVTVVASLTDSCCFFTYWTEDTVVVSTDVAYSFIITKDRTLVAHFEKELYNINVDVNNDDYGSATGTGIFEKCSMVQVEAFANHCYRFAQWTIDSVVISTNNPYSFTVLENVDLVAHFYALEFDTYAVTVCNKIILLNIKNLTEDGYEVVGCKWFKNGIEVKTHSESEFSYAEASDKFLEPEPTYYMFQLTTKKQGELCSSPKILVDQEKTLRCPETETANNLLVYPNPVESGGLLTLEGDIKGNTVYVYNHLGVCVYNIIATENMITFSLDFPQGIYLIRVMDKIVKVAIMK